MKPGNGASRAATELLEDVLPIQTRQVRGPARYPGSLAGQVELLEHVLSGTNSSTALYLPTRVREQIQSERRRQIAAVLERKQVGFFEARPLMLQLSRAEA